MVFRRALCGSLITVALAVALPPLGWAEPISITSQKMTMKHQEHRVVFEGRVVVVKEGFTLHADRVIMRFGPSRRGLLASTAAAQWQDISGMEAEGHAVIEQGIRRAKAERVIYDPQAETLILTGDPEASAAGDVVHGHRITIFLKEDRSLVEGSHVTIQPK